MKNYIDNRPNLVYAIAFGGFIIISLLGLMFPPDNSKTYSDLICERVSETSYECVLEVRL